MTPEPWIDAFARAPDDWTALATLPKPLNDEHGRAFFERIAEGLGTRPQETARLAARWRLIAGSAETRPWALRARGVLERTQGRWTKSVATLRQAAEACQDPSDGLRFQIGAIDSLARAGRVGAAKQLATEIIKGLRAVGDDRSVALASLNLGNALLWHDEYAGALVAFRAASSSLEPDDVFWSAAVLGEATSELFGGSLATARNLAENAVSGFDRAGAVAFAAQALVTLGQADLLAGRPERAIDSFRKAQGAVAPEGLDFARCEEFVGDAFMRLNLWTEALDAYGSAESHPAIRHSILNRANAKLGLATAMAHAGKLKEAEAWAVRAVRDYRAFGNRAWEAYAQVTQARIERRAGDPARAVRTASRALESLRRCRTTGLTGLAALELAEAQVDLGRDPHRTLTVAARALARRPQVAEGWRLHWIRARVSIGPAALNHYRRMAKAMWDSRALTESSLSRANFLNDKNEALAAYLGALLQSDRTAKVREALDVVRESRSVALLDEIVSSSPDVAQDLTFKFDELRGELNRLGDGGPLGPARRTVNGAESSSIARRWIEAALSLRSTLAALPETVHEPDSTFVSTTFGPYVLAEKSARRLGYAQSELESDLSWLRFELLAPLADRGARPCEALKSLRDLKEKLGVSFDKPSTVVCPDGPFWQVPWGAVAGLEGEGEAVVAAGPWSGNGTVGLPDAPRVALWYHGSPELPHVEREAELLMAVFPNASVHKTLEEVRECLKGGNVDLLHVAGHAFYNAGNPMFSSIQFDGGSLTAAEIANSNLRPGLVVLSACETGVVSTARPSEPEGLARSFLARGSRAVLTSFWPLDDGAACHFMYTFYECLSSGGSMVESTKRARSAVRKVWEHPYFWGPFTLFGGYSP